MNQNTYNEDHAQPILSDSKIIILTVILMKELNARTHSRMAEKWTRAGFLSNLLQQKSIWLSV